MYRDQYGRGRLYHHKTYLLMKRISVQLPIVVKNQSRYLTKKEHLFSLLKVKFADGICISPFGEEGTYLYVCDRKENVFYR